MMTHFQVTIMYAPSDGEVVRKLYSTTWNRGAARRAKDVRKNC